MLRIAPEGYPFITGFLALSVLVALFLPLGALLPMGLSLFMIYFFRDPERTVPPGEDAFLAPADGKVILVRATHDDEHLKADAVEISIFMSPLDVHVNRAPAGGTVEAVVHRPGRFLSAFKPEASLENESISMVFGTRHGRVLVRQVAGFVARRAVCRKKPGDVLKRGERFGIIKFSSRVDLLLPSGTKVLVRPGDRVRAGETVVAACG